MDNKHKHLTQNNLLLKSEVEGSKNKLLIYEHLIWKIKVISFRLNCFF